MSLPSLIFSKEVVVSRCAMKTSRQKHVELLTHQMARRLEEIGTDIACEYGDREIREVRIVPAAFLHNPDQQSYRLAVEFTVTQDEADEWHRRIREIAEKRRRDIAEEN